MTSVLDSSKGWFFERFYFLSTAYCYKTEQQQKTQLPNLCLWISWRLGKAKVRQRRMTDPGLMICHILSQ